MHAGRRAMILAGAALVAASVGVASAQSAPSGEATAEPAPYINGFCLGIVAGSAGVQGLRERLSAFGARPAPAGELDAARPEGMEMTGQLFRFAEPGAPDAIADNRRGGCSLIWHQAVLPAEAMKEIEAGQLPVGPDGAKVGWVRVTQYLAGRPRPPKYYLQFGEAGGYGVCAELNTDLRRRDQSPASAVTLYSCRIGKDERLG